MVSTNKERYLELFITSYGVGKVSYMSCNKTFLRGCNLRDDDLNRNNLLLLAWRKTVAMFTCFTDDMEPPKTERFSVLLWSGVIASSLSNLLVMNECWAPSSKRMWVVADLVYESTECIAVLRNVCFLQ